MKEIRLALARVNYSQLYKVYDGGKTYTVRDILTPYHLLTLAGHVRKRGIKVKIFDGELKLINQKELAKEIVDWKPDFVGFNSTTPDINLVAEACSLIKEMNPLIKTIVGGPHPSAVSEDVAKHSSIDYVVIGDGEYPLDLIINKETHNSIDKEIQTGKEDDLYFEEEYKKINSSNATKIIRGGLKTLTNQPMPAYDLLDYSEYQFTDPTKGRQNTASVMTSRGCPFNCLFCFHNKSVRYKTVEQFITEVEYLAKEKGVKFFFVYDDTFTLKKDRVLEILKRIKELDLKGVNFQTSTRGNLLDEELIHALKAAHFVRITMGVESGSDKILTAVNKGVTKDDYRRAFKMLKKSGFETRASFILGLPYDTKDTIRETIEFSKELDIFHANFNIMTPYPGTKTYVMALKGEGIHFRNGEDANNWDAFKRWGSSLIKTDDVTAEELEQLQKDAMMEFYTQEKVYNHHEELFKKGNVSRFFYRPLNFAWQRKYGKDMPFWDKLNKVEVVAAD